MGGCGRRDDVHKLTGLRVTLATETTVMDGWVGGCVGFVVQQEKAIWRSLKPERTPSDASSSPGKGRSEEGDGMG